MKDSVLITIKGGLITGIQTTADMRLIVIDEDNAKIGENPHSFYVPDSILSSSEMDEIIEDAIKS